jgi:hypothetical protein
MKRRSVFRKSRFLHKTLLFEEGARGYHYSTRAGCACSKKWATERLRSMSGRGAFWGDACLIGRPRSIGAVVERWRDSRDSTGILEGLFYGNRIRKVLGNLASHEKAYEIIEALILERAQPNNR